MSSKVPIRQFDAEHTARAAIVAEVLSAEAAVASAQAAAARAYAKAAAHAEETARDGAARDRDMAARSLAAEIGCAGRMSDRTVQHRMDDAEALVTRYPATVLAWGEGRISQTHVRAVADAGLPLDADDRALFDAAAVHICEAETPARARRLLDMLAEKLNPRTLTERHRDARETRAVRVLPLADGMAELTVIVPAALAHAIHDRLTRQARVVKDAAERARTSVPDAPPEGAPMVPASSPAADPEPSPHEIIASDRRTLDQIRADVLADMLLTGCPDADPTATGDAPGALGAIRAVVQVVVPALVLAGTSDDPAELDGRSPIDADTARRLAGGCTGWDRILTHPVTGDVLRTDRYRPTDAMKRYLRARDKHCRFPGCRMPAVRSDEDHTLDYAFGGQTTVENLGHLCKRHHTLKHATPWTVRQLAGGVLEWTSPLGQIYSDDPPAVGPTSVQFVPDGDPPPF
ncbi:DUF222 domain-containing protein [Microbacterium caowuchunii]|uniref:HNH endonuclease signature motif containing protein n=1 Tax=Microbacterium caowuchunii TaxID=2614638 RepID=UPI001248393D|nr:HNH endonuclease signature motif containing protein [Microbacterium caowuchunii]QEW00361.1 DUF222 domain-containing protein [Microbacterium caowuchunii]